MHPVSNEIDTILIVDDIPENLNVLGQLLRSAGYRVKAANSGAAALKLAKSDPQPALILLDVMMPEMDGYMVLQQLRSMPSTQHIPVVFVTALNEVKDEELGLSLGAADYITKPIQSALVLARVKTQIEARWARDWMQHRNTLLEAEVAQRMADNESIQAVSIRALANLAEIRDNETGNHILRTQSYVHLLAHKLRSHPRYTSLLTKHYIDLLVLSAPLHDIGKVGVPDSILLKPGKLTPEEWAVMQTHAALGSQALQAAQQSVNRPVEFLTVAKEIARHHHERWDGTGYPDRLAGDAIPVSARLMAIADVFDALVNARVYKPAFSFEVARTIILEGKGTQFDPDIVNVFEQCFGQFCETAEKMRDGDGTAA